MKNQTKKAVQLLGLIAMTFLFSFSSLSSQAQDEIAFDQMESENVERVEESEEVMAIVRPSAIGAFVDENVESQEARNEIITNIQQYNGAGSGNQAFIMYKRKINEKWQVLATVESIERFDIDDYRVGVGGIYSFDKQSIRIELTEAGKNTLFPQRSVEAEYVRPLSSKLVGYASLRYSDYQQANLENFLTSFAAEYYITGKDMIYARVFISHDDFQRNDDQTSVTGMIKYTRFITDDIRVWAFYANSSESVASPFDTSVGRVEGDTFGIGGSYPIGKNLTIEANIERRMNRNDFVEDTTVFGISIRKRF